VLVEVLLKVVFALVLSVAVWLVVSVTIWLLPLLAEDSL
jgi:hypothetical protein